MTFLPLIDLAEADWDRVIAVNYRSVFLLCKYGVPHMKAGSAIVNISSVHAHETTKNVVPYATSEGGMEAFTRGFSEELAGANQDQLRRSGSGGYAIFLNNANIKSGTEKVSGAVGKPEDIAAIFPLASVKPP